MINLRGDNEFNDGWLHGVFGLPSVAKVPGSIADESWRLGYQTAIETGRSAVMAILPMIELGQVIVTKTDEVNKDLTV